MLVQAPEIIYRTPGEPYTGAIATPQLVGRQEILTQVGSAIHSMGASIIVYLVGLGGVGKTRLLKHILDDLKTNSTLIVARELIDLYHTRNRSVGGLIQSLIDVVRPLWQLVHEQSGETEMDELLIELSRAEQEGLSAAELLGRRQELTDQLLNTLNHFTQQKRLIIALDTAERLFITPDQAQRELGLAHQRPAILEWLLQDFLPKLENTVILIAGRPEPLNLTVELRQVADAQGQRFLPLPIRGLTENETLAYFEAVIERAKASTNPADQKAALIIQEWSEAQRRTIFHCLYDEGAEPRIRPILLALAIDHLVVAGRPLAELIRPLAEAQTLTESQRRSIEEKLGQMLVIHLHEFRRPADEIILTLGWLRKGANSPLLSKLTELSEAETAQAFHQIRDLSFVKLPDPDGYIFLHDEMYALLQRYSLERRSPPERQRIYLRLQEYYEERIHLARTRIDGIYHPQADTYRETLPDPAEVRRTRAQLQDAMVEDFYYRLRWNPAEAFQRYILYATEALAGGDESLWVLLRAELFDFLAERDPQGQAEVIDGLLRRDVVADSAVRWVMWYWSRDRYRKALVLADRLAGPANHLIKPGGDLAQAHLNVWRGYLNIFAGNYALAEELLTQAITLLQQWAQRQKKTAHWAGILGRAYNALGYLYSRQTRIHPAIDAYLKAIQLWQAVRLAVEEANSLNNRAFDLAKLGEFAAAIAMAKEALSIREQLGPRMPVGLSVSTLALILLMQNDLAGGLRDANRAYEIFERLNSLRGMGLARLARAEAKRRTSGSITTLQQGRTAQFLAEALVDAQAALAIFTPPTNADAAATGQWVDEPSRRVEALREQGRIYREWARLRRERPHIVTQAELQSGVKATVEELAHLSELSFQQALAIEPGNSSLALDIQLSRGKLHYYTHCYVNAPNYAEAHANIEHGLLKEIADAIPKEYQRPPTANSKVERVWFLVQAGGLALLRGHLAFNRWLGNQEDSYWFAQAIEQYTIALANYHYFSNKTFQEMREALDQIYAQLSNLTLSQKRHAHILIQATEAQYGLGVGKSRMSDFFQQRFGELEDIELEFV